MERTYTLFLRLVILLSLCNGSAVHGQSAQHVTLSGTVRDSLNGETLDRCQRDGHRHPANGSIHECLWLLFHHRTGRLL